MANFLYLPCLHIVFRADTLLAKDSLLPELLEKSQIILNEKNL